MTNRKILAGATLILSCASLEPDVGPLRLPGGGADAGSEAGDDAAPPADASTGGGGGGAIPQDASGPVTWIVLVAPNDTHVFQPSTLTVAVGDTVQWVWRSSGHSVTSGVNTNPDGVFCSPNDTNCSNGQTSNAGDTYSHTFGAPGTFPYFCIVHGNQGMTGSVTVNAP